MGADVVINTLHQDLKEVASLTHLLRNIANQLGVLRHFLFPFVKPDECLSQVVMKETNGDGMGKICEMSGSDVMVNSLFSMLRKGGDVVLVGLPKKPLHVEEVLKDVGR